MLKNTSSSNPLTLMVAVTSKRLNKELVTQWFVILKFVFLLLLFFKLTCYQVIKQGFKYKVT